MKLNKVIFYFFSILIMTPALALAQWKSGGTATTGYSKAQGVGLPGGSITLIVTNIMKWILVLVGVIGIIGFAIAGILYLTAAGDESKAGKAKNAMTYSIIGIIVAIMGFVIIQAVNSMLGGTSSIF